VLIVKFVLIVYLDSKSFLFHLSALPTVLQLLSKQKYYQRQTELLERNYPKIPLIQKKFLLATPVSCKQTAPIDLMRSLKTVLPLPTAGRMFTAILKMLRKMSL
jgi:hypothetical protein